MVVSREIYVSAVHTELQSAREEVAAALRLLGYKPVWRIYTERDPADCRGQVTREIRRCKAVIQLVGDAYGPEPRASLQVGGRTSYAQYEAISAREIGEPVWHFTIDAAMPRDSRTEEPEELQQLQTTYRRRVETFATSVRAVGSTAELAKGVLALRADLLRLRRRSYLRSLMQAISRLTFDRLWLNGHPPGETSRHIH